MPIIPTVRCSRISTSISFYTKTLDFTYVGGDEHQGDPSFHVLARDGDLLFLSSHRGDGVYGQAIAVLTDDVDVLFPSSACEGWSHPVTPTRPRRFTKVPSIRAGARVSSTCKTQMGTVCGSRRGSAQRLE
jgi:catechol 2,3-dioxygenase-like lactoylglutathione lyase family enzyme